MFAHKSWANKAGKFSREKWEKRVSAAGFYVFIRDCLGESFAFAKEGDPSLLQLYPILQTTLGN